MKRGLIVVVTGLSVLFAGIVLAEQPQMLQKPPRPAPQLQLTNQLPMDPLVAWDVSIGNAGEIYDSILEMVRRFVPEENLPEVEQGIATIDQQLGFSLRDELLAFLGPEMAGAIDFPPIDMAAGSVMSGSPEGITTVVDGIGVWLQVSDAAKVNGALRALFAKAEAEVSDADGIVKVHFGPAEAPATPGQGPPPMDLFYGVEGGVLSFGFSAEAVRARLTPTPAGQSLSDGVDFARVVSHLDPDPKGLFYLNLPKLQQMIEQSQMVKGMLASQAEMKPVMDMLLDPKMASSGIGWSSVEADGGVRQVTFGPSWIGSGVATTGIVAAIAIPNLLNAIDRGRSKRTLADMRSVGTAVQAFLVDNNAYPTSDGWVEVATVADQLAPLYIQTLPATDGWGNAMMFWSDGRHFRLVSPGKGGELDQQWDGDLESATTTDFSSDIVYSDGAFMVYPATE